MTRRTAAQVTAVPSTLMRAGTYGRMSTGDQNAESAKDQNRQNKQIAERIGAVIDPRHVYSDEGIRAGAWRKRHDWNRLVAAVTRREMDVVIVEDFSRIARHYWRGSSEMEKFAKAGVKIADKQFGLIDLNTPQGRIIVTIALQMAEGATETRAIAVRRGQEGAAERGSPGGGKAPLGYAKEYVIDEKTGRRKPVALICNDDDPETVACVQRIFALYARGYSQHAIAKDADIARVLLARTITGDGTRVRHTSIMHILKNPAYGGTAVWGRTARIGETSETSGRKASSKKHDRKQTPIPVKKLIIPPEVYAQVQSRLAVAAKEHKGGRRSKAKHLCSGLLRCVVCGAPYVLTTATGGRRQVYLCSLRKDRPDLCSNRTRVPREALEAHVKVFVDTLVKDPAHLAKLVEQKNASVEVDNQAGRARLEGLDREKKGLETKLRNLDKLLETEDADVADIGKRTREARERLKAIEIERADAQRSMAQPIRVADVIAYREGSASLFSGEMVADRELLHALVEQIRVYPDDNLVATFRVDGLFRANSIEFRRPDADYIPETSTAKRRAQAWNTGAQQVDHARVNALGGFAAWDPPPATFGNHPGAGRTFLDNALYGTLSRS